MRTVADLAGILQLLEAPPLVLVLILVAVAFDFIVPNWEGQPPPLEWHRAKMYPD